MPSFHQKLSLIGLAAVAALALSACGSSESDTRSAVDSFNKTLTADSKKEVVEGLEAAGVSSSEAAAEAAKVSFSLDCPDTVTQEKDFSCTISGTPGNGSAKVEMVVDSNDQLKAVDNAEFQKQLDAVIKSSVDAVVEDAVSA